MTAYPTQPTGDNSIDLINIFAINNTAKTVMSTAEILEGYNNDGETQTPLTETPDGNKFNYFWYQMHNTVKWVVGYILALKDNKLELTGGTLTGTLALGANKATTTYVPTSNEDVTNKLYVDTATSGAMWLGEIKNLAYPTIPTLPAGMEVIECDGRAISRTTYAALFNILGGTWGTGDGSTTFNIPDYRGVAIRGWDNGRGLDPSRQFGSYQVSGAPNITGNVSGSPIFSSNQATGAFVVAGSVGGQDKGGDANGAWYYNFDASRSSAEYKNGLTEIRMKNTTGYFVIRIK